MSDFFEHFLSLSPDKVALSADLMGFKPEHADALRQLTAQRLAGLSVSDRAAYLEMIAVTPGTDLVIDTLDNEGRGIPEAGWLIDATIIAGNSGVMDVYRYKAGGLETTATSDDREKYSEARSHISLQDFASHVVAYENPAYPYKSTQPYDRTIGSYTGLSFNDTDLIDLSNGGRVLSQKGPMQWRKYGLSTSVDSKDLTDKEAIKYSPMAKLNRVTESLDEAAAVLTHLSLAMDLGSQDTRTLVTSFTKKAETLQ